jgi:hypothetical protein
MSASTPWPRFGLALATLRQRVGNVWGVRARPDAEANRCRSNAGNKCAICMFRDSEEDHACVRRPDQPAARPGLVW